MKQKNNTNRKKTSISKVFFTLAWMVAFATPTFSQISRDDAYDALKTDILNGVWQEYDIYVLQNQLSANTVFGLSGQTITSPSSDSWFFFVDVDPNREWPHECKYVFFDVVNGNVTSFDASECPANDLGSMAHINYASVCSGILGTRNLHGRSNPRCVNDNDANGMYAIIINTDKNINSNGGQAHWNDCSTLYKMLRNDFNYPKSHICTFMPKGMLWDLDNDGVNDVNYVASYSDIIQGFSDFANNYSNLGPESTVLIYVAGNGGFNVTEHRLYDTTMYLYWNPTSFANLINNLQAQVKAPFNIVLQFNWSGAFLSALSTSSYGQRVVTSSSSPCGIDFSDITTGSASHPIHFWFTYTWVSGIVGYDLMNSNNFTYADSNYDTYISMQEAYWYAVEQSVNAPVCSHNVNHPMYWSSQNPHYGDIQTLCCRIGYDLYTKDDANDDGFEPNGATIINDSPDIWVRNNADGLTIHQLPLSNTRNYIYVKVRNKGSVVAQGDTLQVFVKPATTNYGSHQQQIASVTMPALQPNTDTVFCFPFMFTPHILYSNCDYSILSVVKSSQDPLHSTLNPASTPMDIASFVRTNNNAAMKNTAFADATGGGSGGGGDVVIIMAGMSGLNGNGSSGSSLQFSVPENEGSLLDVAEITLSVDDNLSEIWKEDIEKNGALKQLDKNTFRIEQENFTLSDFDLPDDESFWGKISFKVNFLTRKVDSSKKLYKYNVLHRNAEDKEVGGITIYVPQERNTLFRADAGNDVVTSRNSTVRLSAREIGEPATYRWYDANGNLVCTGVHFDVTATETAKYTLEVTADSDGYKDYDDVNVFVATGKIVSLSPNPVSGNELTARYGVSETVSCAKLMLFASGSPSELATYSLDLNGTAKKMNIGQLRSGSYTLVLVCDDVAVDSKTFVKH